MEDSNENVREIPVIEVEGTDYSLDNFCSEDNIDQAINNWKSFESKFPPERRIAFTVRNNRLSTMFNLVLVEHFGNYHEGLWDVFCPDGNSRTIGYYVSQRIENGDPVPLTVVLGISDKVSDESFDEFRREIKYIKLTN
mgnify:CR=1 FL=1